MLAVPFRAVISLENTMKSSISEGQLVFPLAACGGYLENLEIPRK